MAASGSTDGPRGHRDAASAADRWARIEAWSDTVETCRLTTADPSVTPRHRTLRDALWDPPPTAHYPLAGIPEGRVRTVVGPGDETRVWVGRGDPLTEAHRLLRHWPLLLNVAAPLAPGGDVGRGAAGWEEELFLRTNYHLTLVSSDDGTVLYPLSGKAAYSPQVLVIKGLDLRPIPDVHAIAILACPADAAASDIGAAFRAGALYGHKALVLAPLGCVAGGDEDPAEAAEAIRRLLAEYKGAFVEVAIIIPSELSDDVVRLFRQALKCGVDGAPPTEAPARRDRPGCPQLDDCESLDPGLGARRPSGPPRPPSIDMDASPPTSDARPPTCPPSFSCPPPTGAGPVARAVGSDAAEAGPRARRRLSEIRPIRFPRRRGVGRAKSAYSIAGPAPTTTIEGPSDQTSVDTTALAVIDPPPEDEKDRHSVNA